MVVTNVSIVQRVFLSSLSISMVTLLAASLCSLVLQPILSHDGTTSYACELFSFGMGSSICGSFDGDKFDVFFCS